MSIGNRLTHIIEANNKFFLERVAREVESKNLFNKKNKNQLSNYAKVVQRTFNINAVGIYTKNAQRLAFAMEDKLKDKKFPTIESYIFYEGYKNKKIKTIIRKMPKSEFIETIGTIPFGVKPMYAKGFVVITTYVGPNFSDTLLAITKGFSRLSPN